MTQEELLKKTKAELLDHMNNEIEKLEKACKMANEAMKKDQEQIDELKSEKMDLQSRVYKLESTIEVVLEFKAR